MLRNLIALSIALLPVSGFAKGNVKTEDYGAFLRSQAPLPHKMSELITQVSDNIEAHAQSMGTAKDSASRAEVAWMGKLVKLQRQAAAALKGIAEQMASARFDPAPHDFSRAPDVAAGMSKQAKLERQMSALLQGSATGIEKKLVEMKRGTMAAASGR